MLCVVRCVLFVVCARCVANGLLCVCGLFVVGALCAVRCVLFVVCCVLFVVCRSLFVCRSLCVVRCC